MRGVLSTAVQIFFQLLSVLILARILMSWFRPNYRTSGNRWFFNLDELVWRATEPILAPIRNLLPGGGMGLDFSPWIATILLQFVGNMLVQILRGAGL